MEALPGPVPTCVQTAPNPRHRGSCFIPAILLLFLKPQPRFCLALPPGIHRCPLPPLFPITKGGKSPKQPRQSQALLQGVQPPPGLHPRLGGRGLPEEPCSTGNNCSIIPRGCSEGRLLCKRRMRRGLQPPAGKPWLSFKPAPAPSSPPPLPPPSRPRACLGSGWAAKQTFPVQGAAGTAHLAHLPAPAAPLGAARGRGDARPDAAVTHSGYELSSASDPSSREPSGAAKAKF